MPIFEYQCSDCDKEFERLVFSEDTDRISCPGCKKNNIKKKMSVASFMTNSLGRCASSPPSSNSSKGFS